MNVETMEGRTLFSVSVSHSDGIYQFNGDGDSDEITITVNMEQSTLTFDNIVYTDVVFLYVNGGGGSDYISITADSYESGIGAVINGDDGDDIIVANFSASIFGGNDNDEIHLGDSFNGEVYGEAGNDYIYVSGYTANAVIDGGAGDDFIDASANLYGVTIYGGAGDDQIYGSHYGDTIYGGDGADIIVALAGDDTIYTSGDGAVDWIDGGDGSDSIYGDVAEIRILNVEYIA